MDAVAAINFLLKYPLIIQNRTNLNEYKGYIKVNNVLYAVALDMAAKPAHLQLADNLHRFKSEIDSYLENNVNMQPEQILNKLVDLVKENVKPLIFPPVKIYRKVIDDVYEFKTLYRHANELKLANDLTSIEISYCDEFNRRHRIAIAIDEENEEFPYKIAVYDLPIELNVQYNSLVKLYNDFVKVIQGLFDYFALMDDLDRNCWIYEPLTPKFCDKYRLVVVEENVHALITINPHNIYDLPIIKFLGSSKTIEKYYNAYHSAASDWNMEHGNILEELLKLFGISEFPVKQTSNDEEMLLVNPGECCICFSSNLDGKFPAIVCPNRSCNRYFHQDCLFKWLCATECRMFLSEIIGKCPNCEKDIHCPKE